MKKENFFKKYKAEIIVGTGAIVSGVLSFVITLNVYPKSKKVENVASPEQKEEYVAKAQDDETFVAQVENENKIEENKIEESKVEENTVNNKVEIKEDIISENIETPDVIEAIAIKKEEKKVEVKKLDFDYPISGDIILEFATDKLVYSETLNEWITHDGIDIKGESASPVKAAESGIIESVKMDPRYGNTIIIKHSDEYKTVYSNLSTLDLVYVGQNVNKGDIISGVGDGFGFESKEGPHVHFEILKNGEAILTNCI